MEGIVIFMSHGQPYTSVSSEPFYYGAVGDRVAVLYTGGCELD